MLKFERHHQPLLSRAEFLRRMQLHGLIALGIAAASLAIGVLGYHFLNGLSWIDALVDAAMILGGMGPVNPLHSDSGKLFAAFYALYSGIVFLVSVGILLAPVIHRYMHHFHLETDEAEEKK